MKQLLILIALFATTLVSAQTVTPDRTGEYCQMRNTLLP